MNLIATMPARNEECFLGLSARAALMWCDALVLYLHACTDRSLDIASEIQNENPGRVSIIVRPEPTWTEMNHRQEMLEEARRMGASHIAAVDADEVLTGNLLPRIRQVVEQFCAPGVILNLPWLALARDPMRVITGASYWGDRQQCSVAFKDQPDYHWSSAQRGGYHFHQRPPLSAAPKKFVNVIPPSQGGLMHLQFLSERRLRAKQALYKCNEVLHHRDNMLGVRASLQQMDAAYSRAVYESDPARNGVDTKDVPREWWSPYESIWNYGGSISDAREPWQEVEVKRLLAEHGRERFAGLDLFGL